MAVYVKPARKRLLDALGPAVWVTTWRMAFVCGPTLIIKKLILGHPMPTWTAALIGLAGGLFGLWATPWLLRWRQGILIWLRVCNGLMKGR